MYILQSLVLIPLLACSFAGYGLLLKQKLNLRGEFIPIVVLAAIACLVYFSGLVGLLAPGAILVMLGGVIAFALSLRRAIISGTSLFEVRLTFFGVGWTIGSLFFFSVLVRTHLVHYDNFSHWAIVVKQMLSTNAFPTADSALIDFKNYPLGISSFLYYVCRFAGHWEPMMITAQGLLIFASLYAMFGIISEKKRFLLYAFLGLGTVSLSFFNLTIRINNLLVDFLLPIFTLAIFAIAYQYRRDPRRAFLAALPIAGLLTVTKSTGIIFAAVGLIFLVFCVFSHRGTQRRAPLALRAFGTVAGALVPYLAWTLHMRLSFSHVENKFDISSIPAAKTDAQISEITHLFLHNATDLTTRPALGVVVVNILAILVSIAAALAHKKWHLWKALIALDAVLVAYYAGIWALYAYSMPWAEASWLAGFERYASSIVILFVGGMALAATVDLENSFFYRIGDVPDERAFLSIHTKRRYQSAVLACMAVSVVLLLSEFNGMSHNLREYPQSLPHQLQQVTGDRWYPGGKEDENRYLLYAPDTNAQVTNYYLQYVGRYYLYAPHVDGICLFYEDNMDNLLGDYDYFVMVESDANARYLLKKHYGIDGEPGVYRIEHVGDTGIALHLEEPAAR